MPELPEVETVVRSLSPQLVGRKITGVSLHWERSVATPHRTFKQQLPGEKIIGVTRRGKYIVIELESKSSLLCHLRMSGDLVVHQASKEPAKHQRVTLRLSDGNEVRFIDIRKFGKMYLLNDASTITNLIGPEPLASSFTSSEFFRMLHSKKKALKPLLLDQKFLAGLGNIYVTESLWRANLHPLKLSNTVSLPQSKKLLSDIRAVLSSAINSSGTDLGDGVWHRGGFAPQVYGRSGENCLHCGQIIEKIVVAQRGTEYCPSCQRM